MSQFVVCTENSPGMKAILDVLGLTDQADTIRSITIKFEANELAKVIVEKNLTLGQLNGIVELMKPTEK